LLLRQKIKKRFKGFNIKIICYLRRQDSYIESFYNQYIKLGNTLDFEIKKQTNYLVYI